MDIDWDGHRFRIVREKEPLTLIGKEMEVFLEESGSGVRVIHRLVNRGFWTVVNAPWAITIMRAGGVALIPLPPAGAHMDNLQPNATLALWAYTNMSDPRFTWGSQLIFVRQDSSARSPQKIGAYNPQGWAAYWSEGHLFTKRTEIGPRSCYPDSGSTTEVFTNEKILELESLGQLSEIDAGHAAEHTELWSLHEGVPEYASEQEWLDAVHAVI